MFDFAAYRAAVEERDADRWLSFFADDAGVIVRQHEVEAWD